MQLFFGHRIEFIARLLNPFFSTGRSKTGPVPGIIASTAYRGQPAVVAGLRPSGMVTTVVSRPQPVVTSIHAHQLRPSLPPARS